MSWDHLHIAKNFEKRIFAASSDFENLTLDTFHFQAKHCKVYADFIRHLGINISHILNIQQIPYLPIAFFKSHPVICDEVKVEMVFESSGTSGSVKSKHYVSRLDLYTKSFLSSFENIYGSPEIFTIFGLLPSYLERENSSLVYMVNELISRSGDKRSDFFMNNYSELAENIKEAEEEGRKILLLGVTYALLDFAEMYPMQLKHTIVMETGGMKGRKEEMTRNEVHELLKTSFKVSEIHSEYGMTELMSQAYARSSGVFHSPPWMKMLTREEDDPFMINMAGSKPQTGAANIIDLANLYSCSFIATDDIVRLNPDESFEILGRLDNSDIRGCSLLSLD